MFIRLVQNRGDFYVRKEREFVVFTGSLSSMTRKRAQALVTGVGWNVQHAVTKLTALALKCEGQKLQLISEKEFLLKIKESIDQLYQNVI